MVNEPSVFLNPWLCVAFLTSDAVSTLQTPVSLGFLNVQQGRQWSYADLPKYISLPSVDKQCAPFLLKTKTSPYNHEQAVFIRTCFLGVGGFGGSRERPPSEN